MGPTRQPTSLRPTRVTRGKDEQRRRGEYQGGSLQYGLLRDTDAEYGVAIDHEAADVIRQAADLVTEGATLRSMPRSVVRRTRRATRHANKEAPPRNSSPGHVPPTSNPDRPTDLPPVGGVQPLVQSGDLCIWVPAPGGAPTKPDGRVLVAPLPKPAAWQPVISDGGGRPSWPARSTRPRHDAGIPGVGDRPAGRRPGCRLRTTLRALHRPP